MATRFLRVGATPTGIGAERSKSSSEAVSGGMRRGGGGGASLAQLESVLQRLNKHDERTQLEDVERTSSHTQLKMVKDQLLHVQEQLVLAQGSKGKLCETIGTLQQTKVHQQQQIDQLLAELRSSRDSLAAMANKVAEIENASQELKKNYNRSITGRIKTASELLAKLHLNGALKHHTDLTKTIANQCDTWMGSQPNKRKRSIPVADHPAVENIAQVQDIVEEKATRSADIDEAMPVHEPVTITDEVAEMDTSTPDEPSVPTTEELPQVVKQAQECGSCKQLAMDKEELKAAAEKELKLATEALTSLQAQHHDLTQLHKHTEANFASLSEQISEKDSVIDKLNDALTAEQDKYEKAMQAKEGNTGREEVESKEDNAAGGTNERVKVLEDNLAQLNTYADHLEMIINQCAACSIKLQSEGTQDMGK